MQTAIPLFRINGVCSISNMWFRSITGTVKRYTILGGSFNEAGKESSKYNELFKEPYRVPNALEKSSPSADVRNVHEFSSSSNSISNPSENVNDSSYNCDDQHRFYYVTLAFIQYAYIELTRFFNFPNQ